MLFVLVEYLGTAYDTEGTVQTPGVALDCSGMIIEMFSDIGIVINDRTAAELISDVFALRTTPPRGPVVEVSFGDGTFSDHIAIKVTPRVFIHSTDDEDLVALNGGSDGVMVTSVINYYRVLSSKTNLSTRFLDFGALLTLNNSES
jgi:cell wall-associated NlpC family hydrolase